MKNPTIRPRMNLREVVDAMRSYGMPMSDCTLAEGIEKGIFQFGHCIDGTFIIMRKDFEDWAADYLIPYADDGKKEEIQ